MAIIDIESDFQLYHRTVLNINSRIDDEKFIYQMLKRFSVGINHNKTIHKLRRMLQKGCK